MANRGCRPMVKTSNLVEVENEEIKAMRIEVWCTKITELRSMW